MKLIGRKLLNDYKENHADARGALTSWEEEVKSENWKTPHDVKRKFPKASILANNQVVFNICGNKYRLLVQIYYPSQIVLPIRIGTHSEYDNW